ncbi:MAG TPA: hypothetical protein ENJ80_04070 [Gammaproteobacteria bacterium]|nr:hypothetical protein [Gammaproteobacteria bacterium]
MQLLFEVHKHRSDILLKGLLALASVALLLFANPGVARDDGTVNLVFVHSQTSAPYLNFIEKVQRELQAGSRFPVHTLSLPASQLDEERSTGTTPSADMIVALGKQAARAIQQWQPDVPVLYALIPRTTYDSLGKSGDLACPGKQCTAIYIDQPLQRIFHILTAAFGKQQRLGVVLGPASSWQQDALVKLAGQTGYALHTVKIHERDELLPALDGILKQSDLLLSLADPVVYNRRTAKSILLTTYRYKVPVVAYSRAYADAGATLSVFSTPGQIARQTASVIRDFFSSHEQGLPQPQYPEHYKIRVNRHVADSLGLDFENKPEFQSIIKEADDE